MQYRIYSLAKSLSFNKLFYCQAIFLTSLSVRFYVVRRILDGNFFSSSFDSLDKINLAFNLVNLDKLLNGCVFNVLFKKNVGSTYNLLFFYSYALCFSLLFSFSLAPILDALSSGVWSDFKPYLDADDLLLFLHEGLFVNKSLNFYSVTKISFSSSNIKVLKESFLNLIPLPKNVLISFVDFFAFFYFETYSYFVYYGFLEFLFLGLLRFGYVNVTLNLFIFL